MFPIDLLMQPSVFLAYLLALSIIFGSFMVPLRIARRKTDEANLWYVSSRLNAVYQTNNEFIQCFRGILRSIWSIFHLFKIVNQINVCWICPFYEFMNLDMFCFFQISFFCSLFGCILDLFTKKVDQLDKMKVQKIFSKSFISIMTSFRHVSSK